MLSLPPTVRVFVAVEPIDMRGSFDSLAGAVRRLGLDPVDGHLYLFLNRRRRIAKAIWFDGSGWCVLANQRSSHYTSFDSRRGPSPSLCDALRAARSLSRSQRLQCFVGWVAGSS